MNETELAEYASKKGFFVAQIKAWRDACMNANGGVVKEAARLNKELKESEKERKKPEKELTRKEKALAETVAAGASLARACDELGLKERTYYRWIHLKKKTGSYGDLRPNAKRKAPSNKLSAEERRTWQI